MSELAGTGAPIPADRYWSASFMSLEWERLWSRVWLLAGPASDLPDAGSFFTFEIGREPILVVRQSSGRVAAFFNVCPHRGNLLCGAERGHAETLSCGYHGWEYRLDGTLARAPGAGPAVNDGVRLRELACEAALGFVWVSMDPAAAGTLRDFLGPVSQAVEAWDPSRWHLRSEISVEIPCNWKTSCDVSNEAYHLGSLHPELRDLIDLGRVRQEALGQHGHITVPLRPGSGRALDLLRIPVAPGAPVAATRAEVLRAVHEWAVLSRVDLSSLREEQLLEKHQFYVFPNVQLNFTVGTLELYRHRPHPADPERMVFDELRFARGAPAVPAPARQGYRLEEAPLDPVMRQDVELLPRLQAGMRSRGCAGLRLTEQEAAIARMHRTLENWLQNGDATPSLP